MSPSTAFTATVHDSRESLAKGTSPNPFGVQVSFYTITRARGIGLAVRSLANHLPYSKEGTAMGMFHHYKDLDGQNGRKIAKFKQATMIDALVERKMIPAELFQFQTGGACFGLVLAWLYMKFGGSGIQRSSQVLVNEFNLQFAKAGVGIQGEYAKNWDPHTWTKRVRSLYQDMNLKVEWDPTNYEDFSKILSAAMGILKQRPACYFSVEWKGKSTGHALGFFMAEDKMHFFDPDIGEYEVLNAAKFFTTWRNVRKKTFGYEAAGGNLAAISRS